VRLKLDENMPRALVDELTARGYDVDTVVDEALDGASDPAVLRAATLADRFVLTMDRGFGDLRRYPPGSHPGIAVVRPDSQDAASVRRLVLRFLDARDLADLRGCIVVVEPQRLRIRRPEAGNRP
jgi:predicted nuclease of predicted toxin-antitoxin system